MAQRRPKVDEIATILEPFTKLPSDRRTWPPFIKDYYDMRAEYGFSQARKEAERLYARHAALKVMLAFMDAQQTEETGEIE